MSQNQSPEYKSVFKIIPTHIWDLDDLTFGALKFYQTIFEFWHAGRDCYLSNSAIMKRTGIKSSAKISTCFKYFEKKGLMKRALIEGKRYILQPRSKIECEPLPEETDTDALSLEGDPPSQCSETPPLSAVRHNIIIEVKKENKEKQEKETPGPSDELLTSVFQNTPSGDPSSFSDFGFDEWFELYPKSYGKAKAAKWWRQQNLSSKPEHMIKILKEDLSPGGQLHHGSVEMKFLPQAATYIEDERWKRENRVAANGKPVVTQEMKAERQVKYEQFLDAQARAHDPFYKACEEDEAAGW